MVALCLLLIILLILSAFFSASETGFVSASKERFHQMKMEGNLKASRILRLLNNKEKLMSVALLGNNIVNIMSSSIATVLCIRIFNYAGNESTSVGILIATLSMTAIIFLFCEVLPKAIALYYAEKVVIFSTPIFVGLIKIFNPILWFTQKLTINIFNILGIKHERDSISKQGNEELIAYVDMRHREGKVVKGDKDMLQGILELSETEVKEVMTHRSDFFAINIDMPKEDIIKILLTSNHTRIPVYKDQLDNILGILHMRSFLVMLSHSNGKYEDIDIEKLLHEPIYIPHNKGLRDQLYEFQKLRNHLALVVDEYGGLMGLITLEDVLEEIVGDIVDESDAEDDEEIEIMPDGVIIMPGDYSVRDFNRKFDLNIELPEVNTMAGLILEQIKRLPIEGDSISLFGYAITVQEMEKNKITKLKLKKIDNIKA